MLRKICIIVALFLGTNTVFGQVKFGVFFDPTITWLRSDVKDVIPSRARLGFDLGMSADLYFARNYAIASGISLFNTGGTLKYINGTQIGTKNGNVRVEPFDNVKFNVQYIKIPIALKFKTHMIGRFIYSANLGFDPMIRASANADFKDEKNAKVNDEIKLLNMGWHFGVGAQYSFGGEFALFGGLSFMNAMMDMTKPARDHITSNNLILRVGIMF